MKRKFVVTTDSRHSLPVAGDLVQRRFNPEVPNQLWSGDITYIATDEGWVYLVAVIDLFSRQVVGMEHAAAHARQSRQGCAGHGMLAPSPHRRPDIPQRPWQPVLQPRVPGCFEELGDALIDEQEGQLGQRTDRELLGPPEDREPLWQEIRHLDVRPWTPSWTGWPSTITDVCIPRWVTSARCRTSTAGTRHSVKRPRKRWAKNYTVQGQGQEMCTTDRCIKCALRAARRRIVGSRARSGSWLL